MQCAQVKISEFVEILCFNQRTALLHTTVAMLPHNNGVLMVKCLCKFHSLSNSSRAVLSTRHEQLPFIHYLRLAEKPPHTIHIAKEQRNGHFSSLLSIPTNRPNFTDKPKYLAKNNNVKWHYRISWILFSRLLFVAIFREAFSSSCIEYIYCHCRTKSIT